MMSRICAFERRDVQDQGRVDASVLIWIFEMGGFMVILVHHQGAAKVLCETAPRAPSHRTDSCIGIPRSQAYPQTAFGQGISYFMSNTIV